MDDQHIVSDDGGWWWWWWWQWDERTQDTGHRTQDRPMTHGATRESEKREQGATSGDEETRTDAPLMKESIDFLDF